MKDLELTVEPQLAEANPAGTALMHQLRGPSRRPHLIGIDGRSGAGKTCLSGQLATILSTAYDVVVFHLEDIYPGWDGLAAGMDHYAQQILPALRRGEDAYWTAWDWVAHTCGAPRLTRAAQIVVLEGVGACCQPARPLLDVSVWVELPEAQRRQRALDRDGETFAPHWDRWAAQEDVYLEADPVWDTADIIQPGPTHPLPGA